MELSGQLYVSSVLFPEREHTISIGCALSQSDRSDEGLYQESNSDRTIRSESFHCLGYPGHTEKPMFRCLLCIVRTVTSSCYYTARWLFLTLKQNLYTVI